MRRCFCFFKQGDVHYEASRTVSSNAMCGEPVHAVQTVFDITPQSNEEDIKTVFGECATQTGTQLQLRESVQAFKEQSKVPKYVLQCCSAKAKKKNIAFPPADAVFV